ncbi:hypothetical protein AwEntero_19840 [Enterobacterales bacterium]|nr:hypothetical protein AwEntero_19840 [Enterobacterales bacterium]
MGVVHCEAFPGSPNYQGKSINKIIDIAMSDAQAYLEGGLHGLIIENHGDIPFSKPEHIGHETAAFMSVITDRIKQEFGCPLGINVLANAAIPAFATALAGGGRCCINIFPAVTV